MYRSNPQRSWFSVLMAVMLTSCALPVSTPTPFVFPTPNQAQTLTAVFQVPPTSTSIPQPTAAAATVAGAATNTPGAGTAAATVSPTPGNCTNKAEFVSETIPDYSYVAPGTNFTKVWTLKNVGTCTWGPGYSVAFDSGNQMGGAASIPVTASTAPNATATFSVNLVAPATLGSYQGMWKLLTPQAAKMDIVVKNTAGTDVNNTDLIWVLINTTAVVPGTGGGTAVPACTAKTQRPDANGGMIEVYTAPVAPTIDADLTEWTTPLVNPIDKRVWHKTGESNGSDTAQYTFKWDANYLYVAVQVTDDNFVQISSGGAELYLGDSVEILLDTDLHGDYCSTVLDSDDYQLGLNPGDLTHAFAASNPGMYLWFPSARKGHVEVLRTGASSIAAVTVPGGYIIEARISWGVFDLPAQTVVGRKFGFAISVSDSDNYGSKDQQRLISMAPNRMLTNPTTWATLELEGRTGP